MRAHISSAASDVKNKRASQKQGKKITGMQYMPAHPNKLLITSNDSRIRLYDGEAAGLQVHQAGHAKAVLYHAAAAAIPCCSSQAAKCFAAAVRCRVSLCCCQHLPPVICTLPELQPICAGFGLQCKFKGHVNRNTQIRASFSAGGEYIVCGSDDGWVYMWNGDDAQYPAGHPRHRSKQASGLTVAKCCSAPACPLGKVTLLLREACCHAISTCAAAACFRST